jgi:uncharacterized RDD family membrane protein YckC
MATMLVNALVRQRVLAGAVDALVPGLAVLVTYLLGGSTAAVVSAGAVVFAYWITVLVWESTTGRTPGNAALGLLTASAAGGPPGIAVVVVRALALGVSWIIPVIGPLVLLISSRWDKNGRRRGWHDKLVGTYVLDVRAGRNPLRTGGLDGGPGPVDTSTQVPQDAPPGLQEDGLAGSGRRVRAGRASTRSSSGADPALRAGRSRADGSLAPAGADNLRGVGSIASEGRTTMVTTDSFVASVPVAVQASTASVGDDAIRSTPVRSSVQDSVGASSVPDSAEGSDPTVRVLVFDDGTEVEIGGQALVGRNPEPRQDEAIGYLINVADLSRSVSKTHVHVGFDQGAVWVTDRGSSNGTFLVDEDGSEQALHPEVAMLLPAGCGVRFGDRRFTIH